MSDRNIFEVASRVKLRFETAKGFLSVEDLWELPLTSARGGVNLDDLGLALVRELRSTGEVISLVDEARTADPVVQLKLELIKHIIADRKAENAAKLEAGHKAETKKKLMEALARKQDGAIDNMSMEDIQKALQEL